MIETLFLETIYHRRELDEMDDLAAGIMDALPSKNFSDPVFRDNLREIERIIRKVFNVDCRIFLHPSVGRGINYGMRIFPSYEEMKGQYIDAVEHKKDGFRMVDCHNVSIEIEGNFLNFMKKLDASPREISAVILHELGHKVYVGSQKDLYEKEYEKVGGIAVKTVGAAVTSLLVPAALGSITLGLSMAVASVLIGSSLIDLASTKYYSEREIFSDSLAVKYGYSREMYQSLSRLQDADGMQHQESRFKSINDLRKNKNYFYLRRKGVIDVLKAELKETKSDRERKLITATLKDLINSQNKDFNEKDTI
jgi:hypothetical protein